ncbi:MAG: hypothetical protein QXR53_04750 [Candidatus Norongarragalinales archaeon]
MKLKVLKKTASGNLLLAPMETEEVAKLENKHLLLGGKKTATVVDVIAGVKKPFVLAKPYVEIPAEVVLESKR